MIAMLLTLFVTSATAQPVVLPPLVNTTVAVLPLPANPPLIPCEKLVGAIADFGTMMNQNNSGINSFLDNVVNQTAAWYSLLQPVASEPGLPLGSKIDSIRDGSTLIGQIGNLNTQNARLLAKNMAVINRSLAACTIATK